jgi:hypothetical protein
MECYELTRADVMTVARRFLDHFLKRGYWVAASFAIVEPSREARD